MSIRIKQVIDALNITQAEFAKRINISPGMVSKICSGSAEPSSRTLSDICEKFGIDINWLETGEGDMFYAQSQYDKLMDYCYTLSKDLHDPIYTQFILAISQCTANELRAIQSFANILLRYQKETPQDGDPEA